MKTIILSKLVAGTSTNDSGYVLFLELDKQLSAGENVKISLENCGSLSTSFLSSSFGEIYDKYGYASIKANITLTNYTSILAGQIKSYLDRLDVHCKS
jgi:hypothetical protein